MITPLIAPAGVVTVLRYDSSDTLIHFLILKSAMLLLILACKCIVLAHLFYICTRSLGPLRAPTSRLRPFWPALGPSGLLALKSFKKMP